MPLIFHDNQEFNLSHDEQEKLNQFQMITNFPDDDLPSIIKLLQNYGWQLERAMSCYYDNDWKASLNAMDTQPPIPERAPTPNPSTSMRQQAQQASPFLISEAIMAPSLPIVKPLPAHYSGAYPVVGLNKRNEELWQMTQGPSTLVMVLMFIPKLLGKVGFSIMSILWGIITFGFRSNITENRVSKVPSKPSNKSIPLDELLPQLADEKAVNSLQKLISNKTAFDEKLKVCEEEFKFLLVILIGDIRPFETDEHDKNSRLLLSKILSGEKLLSFLKSHEQDLMIYIGCVEELEPWLVAKRLQVKYTPECLLIGNVLNSNGSLNGVTRLSVLSKLKMTSPKRFYNSLKLTIDRFNAEMLVSRNEKEELNIAREIRKRQDAAYEESLRQERAKDEKRQKDIEVMLKQQNIQKEKEIQRQWEETSKQLFWLNSCIKLLDKHMSHETLSGDLATVQVRTSEGCRLVEKFPSDTTLYAIYVTIGCFLYLKETKIDLQHWLTRIRSEIEEIAENNSALCFSDLNTLPDEVGIQEIGDFIKQAIRNVPKEYIERENVRFDFDLISPFPRHKISADSIVTVREVMQLWPKGSLLVEKIMEDDDDSSDSNESTVQ